MHLRAWGAAPARSTHGLVHHDVPPKHTLQAAQHAAAAAALEYAKQLSAQNISTTITLASVTTLRDLQDPHDPAAQPVQRPAGAAHGKRRRLHDSPPQIAGRRRPHAKLVARNRAVLANHKNIAPYHPKSSPTPHTKPHASQTQTPTYRPPAARTPAPSGTKAESGTPTTDHPPPPLL